MDAAGLEGGYKSTVCPWEEGDLNKDGSWRGGWDSLLNLLDIICIYYKERSALAIKNPRINSGGKEGMEEV